VIFSLSNQNPCDLSFTLENADVFCFFLASKSFVVPESHWHLAVSTSLRMKREVLLLEEPLKQLPELNRTQRWQVGEKYLWLSPRSLSVFLMAHNEIPFTYDAIKKILETSK
jgi:hypothetical protein